MSFPRERQDAYPGTTQRNGNFLPYLFLFFPFKKTLISTDVKEP